ncbi:hypothetical protein J7337_003662 [Fusarium musae]|uniref:Uncharacterized protein n=1 Tax=Fusarium musae TaxID=1042133 RepID=A0A9P8DKB1_9HYPO|nr:hypothetical protein J7337_003662 [Fusarium musae]KAG9503709.1 hypothetical protein J7337_003662 [Fusarium musae]
MSEKTHYEIPLFDVGIEGAGFRVENVDGELQREHIDQYKNSDISYRSDLVAVVHGTITPEGPLGVLIIIDFHFASIPEKQRFKKVKISMAFGRLDNPIGGDKEPVVAKMAPEGTFAMDQSTQTQVDTIEAHASAEGGMSLATLGIGSSFQRTTTTDTESYAILDGNPWIEVRNKGDWNSVNWRLLENKRLEIGVPAHLRTAVLLSLPDGEKFRADLTVEADIGTWRTKLKRKVGAKTGLHSVYFHPSHVRRDLGQNLIDVDKRNLSACNLEPVGSAKVCNMHFIAGLNCG